MGTVDVLRKVGYTESVAVKMAARFEKMKRPLRTGEVKEVPEIEEEPEVKPAPPISRRPYVMNKSTTEIHSRKSAVTQCNKDLIAEDNREYLTKAAALKRIASGDADGCGHCMSEHSSK